MIDWVSIVRHSRRRFSNYVGTRAPIRMKKRRRAPNSVPVSAPPPPTISSSTHSPQDDHQYTCCCTHVSLLSIDISHLSVKMPGRSVTAGYINMIKQYHTTMRMLAVY